MVNRLTHDYLASAEDEGEVDAKALDDVVDLVKKEYAAQTLEANERAGRAEESRRSLELGVSSRAHQVSTWVAEITFATAALLVIGAFIYSLFNPTNLLVTIPLGILSLLGAIYGFFLFEPKEKFRDWMEKKINGWLLQR